MYKENRVLNNISDALAAVFNDENNKEVEDDLDYVIDILLFD